MTFTENIKLILLFPSSFFDKNIVDEDLEEEYRAANDTKIFESIIFSLNYSLQLNNIDQN